MAQRKPGSAAKWNRKLHRWGSIAIAAPLLLVVVTGVLLQLKKQSDWIQPPTMQGQDTVPTLTYDKVLEALRTIPEAEISSWEDVDRLDVRPAKGIIKVRCKNGWEVQLDGSSGEVLHSALRRSDLIESLHDGSWFHDTAKLWIFLPVALILLGLWGTGIYLFLLPYLVKRRRRTRNSITGESTS